VISATGANLNVGTTPWDGASLVANVSGEGFAHGWVQLWLEDFPRWRSDDLELRLRPETGECEERTLLELRFSYRDASGTMHAEEYLTARTNTACDGY
jgi:hypothetical protein